MVRRDPRPAAVVPLAVLVALVLTAPSGVGASPTLPIADGAVLLSGLSAPTLAPGDSGSVRLALTDPLGVPATSVVLTMEVYAFNAYPGNATGAVPPEPVRFAGANGSGATVTMAWSQLAPGTPTAVTVPVQTTAGTAAGTYALRLEVTFAANGTSYRFASRGYFTAAEWENATATTAGPSTLNLTRLGVSGVVPETAVLVRSNPFPLALALVLAGALLFAGIGGYYAWRAGPGSRSGSRTPEPPSQAESALGNKRTRDGDWRSS